VGESGESIFADSPHAASNSGITMASAIRIASILWHNV
jgi:hypothetical protein